MVIPCPCLFINLFLLINGNFEQCPNLKIKKKIVGKIFNLSEKPQKIFLVYLSAQFPQIKVSSEIQYVLHKNNNILPAREIQVRENNKVKKNIIFHEKNS